MSAYIYATVRSQHKEIRLLELLPGQYDDDLRARLQSASLADDSWPVYETVSYAWGLLTRSVWIDILDSNDNNKTARRAVPMSATLALRRLRLSHRTRMLWIDSVCIDQDNVVERGEQVRLMRQIYTSAMGNLIYLGEIELTMAARMKSTIMALVEHASIQTLGTQGFWSIVMDSNGGWRFGGDGIPFEVDSDAMRSILELPYLRRLWVLQEVALAHHNTAHLGPLTVDFLNILRGILWWQHRGVRALNDDQNDGLICLRNMSLLVDPTFNAQKHVVQTTINAHWCLAIATNYAKSEPRDGVFASLGLLNTALPSELIPDYTKPMSHLLRAATRHALSTDGHLRLLTYINHRDEQDLEHDEFASWAVRVDRSFDSRLDPPRFVRKFCASYGLYKSGISIVPPPTLNSDPSTLVVEGIFVDNVAKIADIVPKAYLDHEDIPKLLAWYKHVLDRLGYLTIPSMTASDLTALLRPLAASLFAETSGLSRKGTEKELSLMIRLLQSLMTAEPNNTGEELLSQALHEIKTYGHSQGPFFLRWTEHRRVFGTSTGLVGLGPKVLLQDDIIVILVGSDFPMILRPCGREQCKLEGPAYVSGIMEGQAVEGHQARGGEVQRFVLR